MRSTLLAALAVFACVSSPLHGQTSDGCALQKAVPTSQTDPAVFTAGVNLDPEVVATPKDLLRRLDRDYKIRINFIPAQTESPVRVSLSGTATSILDQIVQEDSQYRHAMIGGRLVLYPTGSEYQQRVTLPWPSES